MAVGGAYGVFRSNRSSLHLAKTLTDIRQGRLNGMKLEPEPNIPKELTLDVCALWPISRGMKAERFVFDAASGSYLNVAISGFHADQQLVAIAQEWIGKGANYFIRATIPGATDAKIANAMISVMSILYDGGILAGRTEADPNLIVDVYYRKQDGSYVSARLEPPGVGYQ